VRRGGFVQGHDVMAMFGLIACCVLGYRLGGLSLLPASVAIGLGLYVALMLMPRRIHVELGVLLALALAAFIIGGGHLLQRSIGTGWVTVLAVAAPPAVLSILWAFFNRERSE
jgi:hypothetical protein